MFRNKPWVYCIAILPFISSIGRHFHITTQNENSLLAVLSIVAAAYGDVLDVPKEGLKDAGSEVVPEALATLPSVLVNIVVTASIAGNILYSKAKVKQLIRRTDEITASGDDVVQGSTALPKGTFSAAALLCESAFLSSFIGILVALSSSFFPAVRFVAIVSWAACTVSDIVSTTSPKLINAHF